MNNYIIGHIRTYTPIFVGSGLTWLADTMNIIVPDDSSTALIVGLSGLVSAIYYGLIRALAEKWPQVGIMLGYNNAPVYSQAANTVSVHTTNS